LDTLWAIRCPAPPLYSYCKNHRISVVVLFNIDILSIICN
jgi:hypothetical protein